MLRRWQLRLLWSLNRSPLILILLIMLTATDRNRATLDIALIFNLSLLDARDGQLAIFVPVCFALVDVTFSRKNISSCEFASYKAMLVTALFVTAVDDDRIVVAVLDSDLFRAEMATIETDLELVRIVLDSRQANLFLDKLWHLRHLIQEMFRLLEEARAERRHWLLVRVRVQL